MPVNLPHANGVPLCRVLSISAEDVDTVLDIVKEILPNLADVSSSIK